jgi:hypothetical protein
MCPACRAEMVILLNLRMDMILEEGGHVPADHSYQEAREHCYRLMEIRDFLQMEDPKS